MGSRQEHRYRPSCICQRTSQLGAPSERPKATPFMQSPAEVNPTNQNPTAKSLGLGEQNSTAPLHRSGLHYLALPLEFPVFQANEGCKVHSGAHSQLNGGPGMCQTTLGAKPYTRRAGREEFQARQSQDGRGKLWSGEAKKRRSLNTLLCSESPLREQHKTESSLGLRLSNTYLM